MFSKHHVLILSRDKTKESNYVSGIYFPEHRECTSLYENATETYSECSMPGTALDSRDKGSNTEAYTERIKRQRLREWNPAGRQRGQQGTILGGPGPLQHPTESVLNGEVLKYYVIPWKLPQFHNRLCH